MNTNRYLAEDMARVYASCTSQAEYFKNHVGTLNNCFEV